MITKIVNNLKNDNYKLTDIKNFLSMKKRLDVENICKIAEEIQSTNNIKNTYESNIYYPAIYQIEDNCPTCGYRTSESRKKYTEQFITKSVEYRLEDIEKYPITGINCINKNSRDIRELLIILNCLKNKNLKINVKISDYNNLKDISRYDLNSIIIETSINKFNHLNYKNHDANTEYEKELVKIIKEKMKLKTTYDFLVNYGENYRDIFKKINEIKKYDFDTIDIRGFDPFIDCPEEYNPQYPREYILKVITLLRIIFPDKELKIQYASNENQCLKEYMKYGINTITGIYTPQMNLKLQNVDFIQNVKEYF